MTISNTNSTGITAIGDDGLGQQPWWVEQWMELINGYRFKKRLERAWGYAREGHVTSIRFEGRRVHARVQGTDDAPYKVKLWLDVLNDEDWGYVLEALTQKARWSAQLLAGICLQTSNGSQPAASACSRSSCRRCAASAAARTKPTPQTHQRGVFPDGDRFRRPLRAVPAAGPQPNQALEDLAEQRRKALASLAEKRAEDPAPSEEIPVPLLPHPAVLDPALVALQPQPRWRLGGDHSSDGRRHRPRCRRRPAACGRPALPRGP